MSPLTKEELKTQLKVWSSTIILHQDGSEK